MVFLFLGFEAVVVVSVSRNIFRLAYVCLINMFDLQKILGDDGVRVALRADC